MASTALFLWLMMSSVAPTYRMAIAISDLVTAIAAYRYLQIMLSWDPCVQRGQRQLERLEQRISLPIIPILGRLLMKLEHQAQVHSHSF